MQTSSIHQIHDIAPSEDKCICRLCITVLEAIHERHCLHAPYSIGVVTQLQPSSRGVRTRGRGSHRRGTRHALVVSRTSSIDIRAPHPEPQSRGP